MELALTPQELADAAAVINHDLQVSKDHAWKVHGPKFLTPLITPPKSFAFLTADFEAEPWDGTIRRQATWYDGKEVSETAEHPHAEVEFLKRVSTQANGRPIYIHNLSYDGLFLLEGCAKLKWEVEPFYRHKLMSLKIQYGVDEETNKPLIMDFRDSFSLTFSSLGTLTREFGVKHQKIDSREAEKAGVGCQVHGASCPSAHFFNPLYRHNDVKGLYEVLEQMFGILRHDVSLTLAATSMRMFRRYYLTENVKRNNEYLQVSREAFFGGRTEVFRFNEEADKEFWYYDVNSLYPSVMRNLEFPIGTLRRQGGNLETAGITYAVVTEDDGAFPAMPMRGGKMFFYNGIKRGWFVNNELRLARDRGAKVVPIHTIGSDETANLFRDFVDDLYKRRLEAKKAKNGALSFVLKLILNSNFGKWSQQPVATDFFFNDRDVPEGAKSLNDAWSVWTKERDQDSQHIIPIISAFITSGARMRMLKEMDKIGEPDSIYYMDTDSLIIDKPAINSSNALGDFKLEGKIHNFFTFAPKVYGYTDEDNHTNLRLKGVSSHSRDDEFSHKEKLSNMVNFISQRPVENHKGLQSVLSAMRLTDGFKFAYDKHITRTFAGQYDKRRVLSDGSTEPFKHLGLAPKSFENPEYPKVLERVRHQFIKAYAT